jgi:hypothetical protein
MKNLWNSLHENFSVCPFGFLFLFFLFALSFNFQGCQKDQSTIGIDLKDRDDLLKAIFVDTITLTAHAVLEDTLNTKNLQFNFLGYLKDPVFGATTAEIFTQFIPQGNSVNFGNAPQLDSIVLTLRYTGNFYGDTLKPFAINVYRLTEDISSTETYYQNHIFKHSFDNLTYHRNFELYPKPKSKVKLDTIVEAHARIRLNDELGNLFLRNASEIASNDGFKFFFKGLYISAKPIFNDGSLVSFDFASALSGIHLYYKTDTINRHFQFLVKSGQTVKVSHYEHDYTIGNPSFVNQILNTDTLLGKYQLYVQSMGGIRTKIAFPHIQAFRDRRVVINKAELVITNIGEDLSLFPQPARLDVKRKKKGGELEPIPDYGTVYWGGVYNETKKEYRMRITRYIQDILLKDDYPSYLYLVAEKAPSDPNRLILSGTQPIDPSTRLRLELYYTEY